MWGLAVCKCVSCFAENNIKTLNVFSTIIRDMLTTAKTATYVGCFLQLTYTLCGATLQISATFIAGKSVATNHTALRPYSGIQCAAKCFEEGRYNRCRVAGYSRETHTCFLSLDSLQDVSDVVDQNVGIFIMQGIALAILFCTKCSYLLYPWKTSTVRVFANGTHYFSKRESCASLDIILGKLMDFNSLNVILMLIWYGKWFHVVSQRSNTAYYSINYIAYIFFM